jgi:hypothetical protein
MTVIGALGFSRTRRDQSSQRASPKGSAGRSSMSALSPNALTDSRYSFKLDHSRTPTISLTLLVPKYRGELCRRNPGVANRSLNALNPSWQLLLDPY